LANTADDDGATLAMAQAECRFGEAQACMADADRVLAHDPGAAQALAWKGYALCTMGGDQRAKGRQ
jgi:hypothetical protein